MVEVVCQDSPLRLTTTSAFVLLAILPVKIVRSVSNTLFINVLYAPGQESMFQGAFKRIISAYTFRFISKQLINSFHFLVESTDVDIFILCRQKWILI